MPGPTTPNPSQYFTYNPAILIAPLNVLGRVWGLYPFSVTSVTCLGSSDTNLSHVRVSVTSN
jgi:hypothetical protein